MLELKEAAVYEKKKETEKIKKGLRKIDEQEAPVDPRDVLMVRLQSRMLGELTNLDVLKMRYIFTFSGKKGMDRIGFTKFIWEISRFKSLNFDADVQLTEEQEVNKQTAHRKYLRSCISDPSRPNRASSRRCSNSLTGTGMGRFTCETLSASWLCRSWGPRKTSSTRAFPSSIRMATEISPRII